MAQASLIRLYGVTAHFRDPRFNTGKVGSLPLHTLVCPPPCTLHGLLCAAKGGWVATENLIIGWRMDYVSKVSDFQTCWLPQRKEYMRSQRLQKSLMSPRDRVFLSFPCLSILAVSGIETDWFRRPVNALSLGRSEDLVIRTVIESATWESVPSGIIGGQCLPIGIVAGTLYSAPMYFEAGRKPVGFGPKTDAANPQMVHSPSLCHVQPANEDFYLWRFDNAGEKRPSNQS